jgi:phosphonate transport system permease protein
MLARRALEIARTVPELVYALVFVFAFGLGPLPGVLALTLHTAGSLGKLFAEACENVSDQPLQGIRAAGGAWSHVIRFGVLPQILPTLASTTLMRFEVNIRSASVLGLVGAGGIGQELYFVIRQFIYVDISAIVLLIVATVIVTDMICERIRTRLMGGSPQT